MPSVFRRDVAASLFGDAGQAGVPSAQGVIGDAGWPGASLDAGGGQPATRNKASKGWKSPAERLNGHRYHDDWLQNLLVSTSLGGYRR
jgi:hypothetical protein